MKAPTSARHRANDVTRRHRGQPRQAKAFLEQRPFEGHQVLPQEVDGLRIVPQTIVRPAQEEVRHDLEGRIPQGPGQGEGALANFDGALQVACPHKLGGHIGRNPAQPVWVAHGLREPLRLAQIREDAVILAQRPEGITQAKADVNGLLVARATLREMRHGHQRLLEAQPPPPDWPSVPTALSPAWRQ